MSVVVLPWTFSLWIIFGGGQKPWGAKGRGAKDLGGGAKDLGAKDWGQKTGGKRLGGGGQKSCHLYNHIAHVELVVEDPAFAVTLLCLYLLYQPRRRATADFTTSKANLYGTNYC